MEETIATILADLEELHHSSTNSSQHQTLTQSPPIPDSTLHDLQRLVEDCIKNDDPEFIDRFYEEMSLKKLSLTCLVQPICSSMESSNTQSSLLASKLYLSLLLAPNAPVFTLFSPMGFLSLLRAIRKCLKCRSPGSSSGEPGSGSNSGGINRKKKRGGRAREKRPSGGSCEIESGDGFDVKVLFCILERLVLVMGLIHLDRFPDSLKSLVQTVAEIPVMALDFCSNSSLYSKIIDLCSQILCEALGSEHGDRAVSAALVLKSLSSLILSVKSPARSFALGFVTNRIVDMAKGCEDIEKAVVNMPRYLVHKAPEKSEPRGVAVESIVEIVKAMGYSDQVGFVDYVVKMTQGKSSLRLLAVDLVLALMMSLRDPFEGKNTWGVKCLEALIQRCSDSSALIRARALSNTSQLVGFFARDERAFAPLKELMELGSGHGELPEGGMNDILRKRCMDEKAAVRRAALNLVTKLMALLGGHFDGVVLKTMGVACSDPLVSIRKAAMSALSEAFRNSSDENVVVEWLHCVPRLINDNESSIQEECENLFLELVLDRISVAGSSLSPHDHFATNGFTASSKDFEKQINLLFPEGVLCLLREICHTEVTTWVKKICTNIGKKNRLRPRIATALQNIIRTSENLWISLSAPIEKWTAPKGAWFLLSEVSEFLPKAVDWEFLHHHWRLLDNDGAEGAVRRPYGHEELFSEDDAMENNSVAWAGDRVFLLETISKVSLELPAEMAADLAHNLLKRVEEFNMHPIEVTAHVKALRTLCKRKASGLEEAVTLVMRWVKQLLSKASQILEKYITEETQRNKDGSLFTPPQSENRRGKKSAATSKLLADAVNAVYTIGSLMIVCPSADTSSIIPLVHTIITSGDSDTKQKKLPTPAVSLEKTAPSLYIHAWLTMGKICLADGKLAKRYIPLFVQELEKSDIAALRNNLVVMLTDFCVRYTALVDGYIAKITRCLCDPCEVVRRQTFILLSRLLQRDYVKWRGVLFLRFLLSLVDESERIRQLADFLFGNILKVKAPLLAYNSFVEAVFVLNDCRVHSGHCTTQGSRAESRLFSIRGNDETSRSKRMHIYISLLKQMAPEHLLATFAKICAEILASASDGMLNIDDTTGQSVLQDAFRILVCKEIRNTHRSAASDSAEIDEEGGESGGSSASAARGRAITQAVRKGLIQNTIPIFIELKRLLESKNSPLTGSLMECLCLLLKDYKNEIDDMLVADKQLQKELIYDMQRYESVKARTEAAEAVAAMQKSKKYQTPGAPNNVHKQNTHAGETQNDCRVASALADAAAEATARSVLREVNRGTPTPALSSLNVPKVKTTNGGTGVKSDRPKDVLESLRRMQPFLSDDEN